MTKTTASKFVAPIGIMGGGVWGSGATPEEALKRACKEFMSFASGLGGLKPDARIEVNVYEVPAGHYWHKDYRGDFIVDYDTDVITAYAKVTHRFVEVDPRKPAGAKTGNPGDAYMSGTTEAVDRANRERRAPIGEKI